MPSATRRRPPLATPRLHEPIDRAHHVAKAHDAPKAGCDPSRALLQQCVEVPRQLRFAHGPEEPHGDAAISAEDDGSWQRGRTDVPNTAASAATGSDHEGQVMSKSRSKARALTMLSRTFTPTKVTPSSRYALGDTAQRGCFLYARPAPRGRKADHTSRGPRFWSDTDSESPAIVWPSSAGAATRDAAG